MLVKIHEGKRKIIAICDEELLDKKFEEGNMQLEVNKIFYGGEKLNEKGIIKIMKEELENGSTFNLVGEKTISAALKAKIIEKEGIIKIKKIPHALIF